jgi:virginiamycin B lyase
VWFTAQRRGAVGILDSATGRVTYVPLGTGSRPHGVITGPDNAIWITDGGANAIVRVDPADNKVTRYPLPSRFPDVDLNTAAFDPHGVLWFTGEAGFYGSLDPRTGTVTVKPAPRGGGPYGITSCRDGHVYFASLAGDYVGRIDIATGDVTVLDPPQKRQGPRRIWADSKGILWASGWYSGNLIRLDPQRREWKFFHLPGENPRPYALFVDDRDRVWVSDWGSNSIYIFSQETAAFIAHPLPSPQAGVRQMLGRPGELWAAESGVDKLFRVRSQ